MSSVFIELPPNGSGSWKDPVASNVNLPAIGNSNGDTRVTLDTDDIYIWNGTSWVLVASPGAATAITGLIGDVTATGPGTAVATIANSVVTNAKLNVMPNNTVKGNKSGGIANPSDLALSDVAEATSSVLTISNGSKVIVGASNLTIQVTQSTTSTSGYLSSTDWNTFNSKFSSPLTTKGDILGFSTVNARIPVGTDGQILAADSTQTLGVKWITNASGGNVVGPVSSTNRAISTWNGTGGTNLFDNPAATIDASGNIAATNLTGTNSGDVTLAAVGASPSANAASLSGQVLTLQPADGTHPGVVTSGAQTIGGAKTFTGAISASNLSGTNTGDQTITLTGDVTGSGTGSFAATIAANAVTNAKLAQMPTLTIKGNNTGGTANALDLTVSQVNAMLGNSGDVTLGAFGSAPNNNAASLAGQVLTLQPADLTHPGGVSTTTQSFGGAKTFVAPLAITGSNAAALSVNSTSFVVNSTTSTIGINTAPVAGAVITSVSDTSGGNVAVVADGYGTGNISYRIRRARGTAGSPTAAQTDDILGSYGALGYGATAFSTVNNAAIRFLAAQNFTDSAYGTYLTLNTVPNGSTSLTERVRVNQTGNVLVAQTSDDGVNKIQVTGSTIATSTSSASAHLATGTAGAGFLQAVNQSSAPGTPTTAGRIYFDNTNRFTWIGTNGFTRTLDGTGNSANRVYTLPDVSANLVSDILAYGDGSAGNVTISSGTTTLTQDTYYNNLTISGTGILATAGFRIFVAGILDISAAPAGAIKLNGSNGNTSVGSAGGTGGNSAAGVTLGISSTGGTGATAVTGNGATAATPSAIAANGGNGGTAGASGAGTGGTSAAGRAFAANLILPFRRIDYNLMRGATLIAGGGAGPGGSGGGGDGTNTGGGGGGGGGFAGVIGIWANTINRGASTTAAAIQAIGGNGGNGRTQPTGTVGGGGGGAGGGGGWVYIVYNTLTGATATGCIDVTGGNGGAGGNGVGAGGNGGAGGGTGVSGRVTLISVNTGVISDTANVQATTAGNAASGATGGGTQAATTARVDL